VNEIMVVLIVFVYIAIGIGVMFWIQKDNEFRHSEAAQLLAYGSIVLWPIFGIVWLATRPPEQVTDLAAKKSYQDFKNFMRSRRNLDTSLLSKLDKATTPEDPLHIKQEEEFRDYHLEELIEAKQWQEATRTANDMLRFAREQMEFQRVEAYERYVKRIKELHLEEIGRNL